MFSNAGHRRRRRPLIQKLPSFCQWSVLLRINCFFHGKSRCRLCISLPDASPSPGVIQIAEYLGSVIEKIPDSITEQYFFDQYVDNPFVDENGQPLENNSLYQELQAVIGNQLYYLCRIQDCIRQADRLFKNLPSPGPGFAYYEEHAQKCLIGEAAAQLKLDSWLYQGLKFLESYDSSKKRITIKHCAALPKIILSKIRQLLFYIAPE